MVTNGGFLVTKIKQLGDRIFEKVLAEKGIDAFNGAQGRILYVLWQQDGVPIKTVSDTCGLAITSLTTMLERMERQGMGALYYKGFTEDEIRQFEEYLQRIQRNLEEKLKP